MSGSQGHSREDVAAAAQRRLEEVVCEAVAGLGGQGARISLAGGVFANVKLNQRLCELPNVGDVYVFPNMGDGGGLSVGAAWLAHQEATSSRPEPMRTALLGNDLDEDEILRAIAESGLHAKKQSNINETIAELLAKGHVVARASGRMEFGPRALGNRSILYRCDEPEVNQWLNARLARSEFMPFAPASLSESAELLYRGLDKGRNAAPYMTMTFDCTERMTVESPAAVHVDETARPQLVDSSTYPDFHAVLTRYRKLTGKSSVVNTSFNMHEEPIVCSAADAIRAFRASSLPWLALGDYLVAGDAEVLSN
jgi:carbamoyltransferase